MNFNQEQRDIIRRIDEVTARFDAVMTTVQAARVVVSPNLIDAMAELNKAIDRSIELVTINKQYGDLIQELLETL